MAKKRVTKTAIRGPGRPAKTTARAHNSRKEAYSSDRLGRVVERLREQAARISALTRQMQENDLDEVPVDGHAMLLRGLNQIDNFADNAARAVREAGQAQEGI